MSGIAGRHTKLEVSVDGTAYIPVKGIVDVDHPLDVDELETTDHDSEGGREYEPNHHSAQMNVTGRWRDLDPGQELLLESIFDKRKLFYRYRPKVSNGLKQFVGTCFVTNGTPSGPLDDAAGFDITLRCSGVRKETITGVS